MILAGDIGGTKVVLSLFQEQEDGGLNQVKEARYSSAKHAGLDKILEEFLRETPPGIEKACFGIAGPVIDGICETTNLPWVVALDKMKTFLGIEDVWLINDLVAMASAIPFLDPKDVEVLQEGQEKEDGCTALIAAGTGLGQAFLVPGMDGGYQVLDSEGGHVDFAPRNEMEIDLLKFFLKKFKRVSVERVLSGSGLYHIYQFINFREAGKEPEWLQNEFKEHDPAAVIAKNALQRKFSACEKALNLFVNIYGAVAGNLALQVMATGGVFIGGGMAPKILPIIQDGGFMKSFLSKGRFTKLLQGFSVKLIKNEGASLIGAAHYALGE